jgi:hypothetical protein
LAGKSEAQLIQALKDFKSGKRDNAVMKGMASPLSDQDMENLAAYYASLKWRLGSGIFRPYHKSPAINAGNVCNMAWAVFGYFGGQREEPTGAASAMRVNWQNDALAQFTGIRQHRDLDGLRQPELQRAIARRVAHWPVVAGKTQNPWSLPAPTWSTVCAIASLVTEAPTAFDPRW